MSPINLREDRLLILDFGSQYTQLIARRVRESGVYCEILPYDVSDAEVLAFSPKGILLSGGPESVTVEGGPRAPQIVFTLGVPVLGICYGLQTMAAQLGGEVEPSVKREYGYAQVRRCSTSRLLPEDDFLEVWMSHGDRVRSLPSGFQVIAATDHAPLAGIADESRRLYGLQFHPEVTHTPQGVQILSRFVHEICGCANHWTSSKIIEDSIVKIQDQVGNEEVLLALSGGVDSAVVAALLQRAIGDRLTCIFVDNGLLRLSEGDQVMATFARYLGVRVIRVQAKDRFFDALTGVSDPEKKRKTIGNLFIEVFEEEAARLPKVRWLAQGTIYPDVIESAGARTGKAHVIKSHHNVGGLPERMKLQLIEPLRDLFKDEVRKIGLELGLPRDLVYRHPFPGPGLGVRILGEVKREYAEILRAADHIYLEELRKSNLYDEVSQGFAVFLPIKSVGVLGDARHYDYVIALRAVQTVDFMTAKWARLPHEFLDRVSNRIINELSGVSRVVYDISGKPPATIEWE
ncbi:GMP synthetase [Gammaproteobacteria bacterium]